MESYITFFASVMETLTVYFIIILLDKKNRMPAHKVVLYVLLVGVGITIADAMGVPYQFFFTLITYTVFLRMFVKKKLLLLLMDLIIAIGCYFLVQLITSLIIGYLYGNILNNYYLLFLMLFLFAAIFYGLGHCKRVATRIEQFYTRNRDIVAWIAINICFSILIVLNLWNDMDTILWKEQFSILLLISIIYLLNGGLLISFLHRKKQKEKMKGYQEYGKYLEEMMHQLSSKQHEFANQINVMMGLAQTKKDEKLSLAIIEYGERILDEKKRASAEAIICDDSMIAAMLYQKKRQAEKEKIQFECLIEKPFPSYSATAYDLVELIVNLLNNAFEAVSGLDDRQVFLKMNTGNIEVINTVSNTFDAASIVKFSETGYSTKGKQRGYGVSNIKTIINRYHGQLDIYRQDNIIVFSILLP